VRGKGVPFLTWTLTWRRKVGKGNMLSPGKGLKSLLLEREKSKASVQRRGCGRGDERGDGSDRRRHPSPRPLGRRRCLTNLRKGDGKVTHFHSQVRVILSLRGEGLRSPLLGRKRKRIFTFFFLGEPIFIPYKLGGVGKKKLLPSREKKRRVFSEISASPMFWKKKKGRGSRLERELSYIPLQGGGGGKRSPSGGDEFFIPLGTRKEKEEGRGLLRSCVSQRGKRRRLCLAQDRG